MRTLSQGPLLVVAVDPEVHRSALRVGALAGLAIVTSPPAPLPAAWAGAAAIVLDGASAVAASDLPRRTDVVVATAAEPDLVVWQRAVAVGAQTVLCLPRDERSLLDRLLAATAPAPTGRLLCCLPARGGAGASTLAAAIAVVGADSGRTMLVDADPAAGGIDLLLGIESSPGPRWPDFADAAGTLPPDALATLPVARRAAVLSCSGSAAQPIAPDAATAVLDAARRVHDLVVVDLPCGGTLPPPGATAVIVVVPAEVRAVTAAAVAVRTLAAAGHEVRVVVRVPGPGDLRPRHVAEVLGAPLAATWRWQRRLDAHVDAGRFLPAFRGSSLAKVARTLLSATERAA